MVHVEEMRGLVRNHRDMMRGQTDHVLDVLLRILSEQRLPDDLLLKDRDVEHIEQALHLASHLRVHFRAHVTQYVFGTHGFVASGGKWKRIDPVPNTHTHMARTERMTNALLAVSTTPRTTRRHVEELERMCQRTHRNEIIYTEVKTCMDGGDVGAAVTLLDLLPRDYKRVSEYRRQCAMYDTLCRNGIVERAGLAKIQGRLGEILHERSDSKHVVRYADALVRNGYNETSVMSSTMYSMEETMVVAGMTEGHRMLFAAFAEWNTPFVARTWVRLLLSIEKCAPLLAALKPKKTATRRTKDEDNKDEDKEDEDPTNGDDE